MCHFSASYHPQLREDGGVCLCDKQWRSWRSSVPSPSSTEGARGTALGTSRRWNPPCAGLPPALLATSLSVHAALCLTCILAAAHVAQAPWRGEIRPRDTKARTPPASCQTVSPWAPPFPFLANFSLQVLVAASFTLGSPVAQW